MTAKGGGAPRNDKEGRGPQDDGKGRGAPQNGNRGVGPHLHFSPSLDSYP